MKNYSRCFAAAAALSCFARLAEGTQADQATITINAKHAGPSPFISKVKMTATAADTLASIRFTISPKTGSVTRPVTATYTRSYLEGRGNFDPATGKITVPVFGLYAGYHNTVTLSYSFQDGSSKEATTAITTAAFDDPCGFDTPGVRQARTAATDLSYEFVLIASNCERGSPTIVDTDGVIRWIGTAGISSPVTRFYDKAIYLADGPRLLRMELDGTVSLLGDYTSIGLLHFTHNLDVGKHGLIGDIDTPEYVESANIEVDRAGKVLKRWNMAKVIGDAMRAGGDDPDQFITKAKGNYNAKSPEDWWHNNSTAYRRSDNSLIISSRENFVIAIDYDTSAIRWIFGDTTKQWYQFPSLRKYALTAGPNTLAPDGQHSVGITHDNRLLLFDNGKESLHHHPAGPFRKSAARKYRLDLRNRIATEVWTYPEHSAFSTPFCSSVYEDAPFNYLLDYAQRSSSNGRFGEILGLTATGEKVFDYTYPTGGCQDAAYRSLPVHLGNLLFDKLPPES